MPTYTLPTSSNLNSSAGMISFLIFVNNATFGWLSRILLIGLYIITIMAYNRAKNDLVGGIAIAGFGTFVIAFLLMITDFVSGIDLAVSFAVMIVGIAWILLDKQGTA